MLRAVIFDFDGLLLDTESAEYEEWRHIFSSHGAHLSLQDWVKYVGTWVDASLLDLLDDRTTRPFDRAELRRQHASAVRANVDSKSFCEGVTSLVPALRQAGLKVAIASNSDLPWVKSHLDHRNYRSNFDVICTRENVKHLKPDPDIYLLTLQKLGVKASEAVVFEDSLPGTTAALRAGIQVYVVPNSITVQSVFPAQATVLRSLADVSPTMLRENATVLAS